MMKAKTFKTILSTILIAISGTCILAQNGLENVIVEKYYVSDSTDEAGSIGALPVGSVTYRIYIDMLPGYEFVLAYGDVNHQLLFKTSTAFFNNEDRGNIYPSFTKTQAKNNTVMLDSWLSVGAACSGYLGVLKSEDDSVETVVNADGLLKNNDTTAGIPLTEQDGMVAGVPAGSFGTIGIDSAQMVFDATSQAGSIFKTTDGAWFCLEGAIGPNDDNKVLIAQMTTDGQFSFELNIQLRTPDGGVEKYVANNPLLWDGVQEVQHPGLTYVSSEKGGLENLTVENYYVSNSDDAAKSEGTLPINSVTYRIFANMLPGYKFLKAYGSTEHPLSIKTTTSFFNNEDKGSTHPDYTFAQAANNTVMLDSWLSTGAACVGHEGILKSNDDGISNIVNADGVLANTNSNAGIPLTTQDGIIAGNPGSFATEGIESEIAVFGPVSQSGNSFETTDGSWFCAEGASGPDEDNNVLIAQVTSDGVMSYELNIQLLTPAGDTQYYVAKNPTGNEIILNSLTYTSPTINAIKEQHNQRQFSVYPNPAINSVTINLNSDNASMVCSFNLKSITGSIVETGLIENSVGRIDLSSYPNGIYFIEVNINGSSVNEKLIICK
jgi:hypothetical protein